MEFEHGAEETVQRVFGDEKDFYEILGLKKTATQKEIKRAYRKMALKYVRRRFLVSSLWFDFFSLDQRSYHVPSVFLFGFLFRVTNNSPIKTYSASG